MSLLPMLASGGSVPTQYVEDVFSTYLYTGNGTTQTINNGIDLATYGGLVWLKDRTSTGGNSLFDTSRGVLKSLCTNNTNAQLTWAEPTSVNAFNSNGFVVGGADGDHNFSASKYVSWTFRKAPKFFDVVTYTGNGVAGRQIAHNLGVAPGMIIVKCTSTSSNWAVYHRGQTSASYYTKLNLTDAQASDTTVWNGATPTTTNFTVGTSALTNTNGATYVAYLFAHDPSADGIIQCGSFTTDASGNATVNLGWEPQYLMVKSSSVASYWNIFDTMRGWTVGGGDQQLQADTSNAESVGATRGNPTATGFYYEFSGAPSAQFIYLAIRRPMKTPTSGTEVYNAIARTGTGQTTTISSNGFVIDTIMPTGRNGGTTYGGHYITDRIRGGDRTLNTQSTNAESTDGLKSISLKNQKEYVFGASDINVFNQPYIDHIFKRATGFFDVVCYTGTGVTLQVPHNLGVEPELMVIKSRNQTTLWGVYSKELHGGALDYYTVLNSNQANTFNGAPLWGVNTDAYFTAVGGSAIVNGSSAFKYVAYLFSSCPGVSKVGSYTGNGTSQTINCGFTTGARFVLIKRTDSTGDWYVWDTARGIVAANDPHLSLNTTAAEVTTDDSVDPDTSGFIVNQVSATNINVTSATYIYLAIA